MSTADFDATNWNYR